ncbi:PsiF family protein [Sulfuriferula thiophila]|uniref:PsiF family protein n=1 Tax=Sulfuriferula thiophila TaxID=1781211 RepID=UPI000F613F52|nr:PsiF family protein [Sulfuriferula thiophila]
MNKLLTALLMSVVFSVASFAAHAKTAQQEKMGACNKEAASKTLKGDERKSFMKSCLSAKPEAAATPATPAAAATPQNAMTTCNKAATGKKGDERKAYMSSCLKAKGPENMK